MRRNDRPMMSAFALGFDAHTCDLRSSQVVRHGRIVRSRFKGAPILRLRHLSSGLDKPEGPGEKLEACARRRLCQARHGAPRCDAGWWWPGRPAGGDSACTIAGSATPAWLPARGRPYCHGDGQRAQQHRVRDLAATVCEISPFYAAATKLLVISSYL